MERSGTEHPRISNRGVQNTQVVLNANENDISTNDYDLVGDLKCLFDWFEFTIPITCPLEKVFEIMAIHKDNFKLLESEKRILGYGTTYMNGKMLVLTNGTPEMGHHVQFKGQGCREYEMHVGNRWYDLINGILAVGGKFSRLDAAIDDFKGYFHIPDLVEKIKDGELTSKFKRAKRIEDILIKDGSTKGTSLYYGRGSSDIQIRMYEKNFEQQEEDSLTIWNRTEIQMRNDRATTFAKHFITTGGKVGQLTLSVLSNYLTFRDKNPFDENKSRWEVSEFWTSFLHAVGKLSLATKKPDRSVERIQRWLDHQVSKSMAIIAQLEPEMINEIILEGSGKITEKDEQIMLSYIKEKELKEDYLQARKTEKKNNLLTARRLR